MADRIGQQFGNYRLTRLLGRGGFAEVYLGEHIFLKNYAAIKLLPTFVKDGDVEDFLGEAQTLARLLHPHIVRILDFAVVADTPFLVMDYAPNGTLRQRYPKGTCLPLDTIVSYVKQIAAALQYAHDQKLIHRDVKPENMLLGANNDVLLSDFGIAAVARTTGSLITQGMAGTIHYMAPEQLQGKPRPASDQYALGIVVYEWLCGARPFQGSHLEIMSQHLHTPPPPLREQMPKIPPMVEQVVMKALAKEPQQRFPNVQDFATALERATQKPLTTAEAPPIPPPVPPLTPDPRPAPIKQERGFSRGKAALLIGIALIVVFGSVGLLYFLALKPQPIVHTPTPTATTPIHPIPSPTLDKRPPAPSDYAMFGYDPQHTHFNQYETMLSPSNVSGLVQDWTGDTGYSISSSPAVANGVVYVGSEDGGLYAFDVSTHKLRWAASIGSPIYSSPAVANGIVYVGLEDGNLYAFNALGCGSSVCRPLWKAPTGGEILSSPVVENGAVYIGSYDKDLYAFNANTGAPFWHSPASTGGSIQSSPAIANGVVYVGSNDGNLYAFDANTGAQLWYASTGKFVYSSPAVDVIGGVVYVGSADKKLYAFSALGCGKPPCPALWTYTTGDLVSSSPAIANGVVYVGSDDKKLYAINASNGQLLWTSNPAGDSFVSSPVVANGVVYIGSYDGKLYAFSALGCGKPSCSALWTYITGGIIKSSPAVTNGVVYVGSADKKLYAFHLRGTMP